MIKSQATKIRIANRKEARRLFNRSTSDGREAYRESLRGLLVKPMSSKRKAVIGDD